MKGLEAIKGKFAESTKAAEQFTDATKDIAKAAESAGQGAARAAGGGLKQFFSSIMRIAKYRLIRTAIRELMAAFKEGLQNAYAFSSGMDGEAGNLAKAMDGIKSAAGVMKNQLGAAFGELLQNIAPIIIAIINLITRLANALSQLFAFLGGRGGYLKATADGAGELEDNLGGGAKKAKELRRQLMGFDEINRLDAPNNPSGGGGGGAAAEDYSGLFEFANFDEWVAKLEPLRQAISDLWNEIKTQAVAVWEFIKANVNFEELFDGIVQTLKGVVQFVGGILSGDWTTAFQGAANIVEGLWKAIQQAGNFIMSIVDNLLGYVGGLVISFWEWLANVTGVDLSGIITFMKGMLSGLRQFIGDIWTSVKMIITGIITFLSGVFTGDWQKVWEGVKQIFLGIWNALLSVLMGIANTIISIINGIIAKINWVLSVFGGSIPTINYYPSPSYATGGFPEDGIFAANHGELVGQFSNGRTAVVNNEQIVEGIRRAVVDGMSAVVSSMGNGSQEVRVYLDGKQISNAVTRGQRQMSRATGVAYA